MTSYDTTCLPFSSSLAAANSSFYSSSSYLRTSYYPYARIPLSAAGLDYWIPAVFRISWTWFPFRFTLFSSCLLFPLGYRPFGRRHFLLVHQPWRFFALVVGSCIRLGGRSFWQTPSCLAFWVGVRSSVAFGSLVFRSLLSPVGFLYFLFYQQYPISFIPSLNAPTL